MSEVVAGIVRENIRELKPYQPGKPIEEVERDLGISGAIKLASNENPLGPSPLALEAVRKSLADCNLYPDGAAFYLRRALADQHAIDPERFVFGTTGYRLSPMGASSLRRR
jgi:histidinol-phosphate aminotransferase